LLDKQPSTLEGTFNKEEKEVITADTAGMYDKQRKGESANLGAVREAALVALKKWWSEGWLSRKEKIAAAQRTAAGPRTVAAPRTTVVPETAASPRTGSQAVRPPPTAHQQLSWAQ
jgi:hypothetical protein